MKKNNFKSLLLAIVAVLTIPLSQAGQEGHGGDGIIINGKTYLLDLVEYGVEKQIENTVKLDCLYDQSEFENLLNLSIKEKTVRKIIIERLGELCSVSSSSSISIAKATNSLFFNFVNLGLVDIKDEETPVEYAKKQIVQLAARQNNKVLIDAAKWKTLDDWNKAALIMHETVYSMITPQYVSFNNFKQPSPYARDIVGSLFSGKLMNMNRDIRNKILGRIGVDEAPVQKYEDEKYGHVKIQFSFNTIDPVTFTFPVTKENFDSSINKIAEKMCRMAIFEPKYIDQAGTTQFRLEARSYNLLQQLTDYVQVINKVRVKRTWLQTEYSSVSDYSPRLISLSVAQEDNQKCLEKSKTLILGIYNEALAQR